MAMTNGYLLEHANATHPGVLVMQNGSSIFPLKQFVDNCNNAVSLVNAEQEFFNFISTAINDVDTLNQFSKTCKKLCDQSGGGLVLKLRNKNKKVCVPDADYFNERYKEAMRTPENSTMREEAAKKLFKDFNYALNSAIATNDKYAKELFNGKSLN